jgi:hypothetical protein
MAEAEPFHPKPIPSASQHALDSMMHGLSELEAMAKRFDTIGPAMEAIAMAAAIPGFGKVADELTDEDREARATYFAQRTAGLGIGQPLPYDKTKAQA